MGKYCECCMWKRPHFFKPLLENSSEQLELPPAFVHHIKKGASHAILETVVLKSWPVELVTDGNRLLFRAGWRKFFEHHKLEIGDFLVFTYNGDLHFTVKILGRSCCEKKRLLVDEDIGAKAYWPVGVPSKILAPVSLVDCDNDGCGEQPSPPDDGDSLHAQRKVEKTQRSGTSIMSKELQPSNPSFTVVLRVYGRYLQQYVNIPNDFTRLLLEESKPWSLDPKTVPGAFKFTLYNLSDPSVRPCKVKLIPRVCKEKMHGYTISAGWSKFCKKSKLKPGDACIFEFNNEWSGFNVYVDRGACSHSQLLY